MTTLAIASQKGGVGKTTVALNLALALARRGWHTLLVDADPQGSIGRSIRGSDQKGKGLTSCLSGRASLKEAVIVTRQSDFHLLTAGSGSMDADDDGRLPVADTEKVGALLRDAAENYDVVLVDTPSGIYGQTFDLLLEVDQLLVPIQAEPLALRTVAQVLDAVSRLRQKAPDLSVAGFLITMLNSRDEVSLSVAQESWGMIPPELVLDGWVPRDAAFLRASAYGVPLALLSRRPPAVATIFDQIAAELEPRLGLIAGDEADEPIALLD